MLRYIKIWMLLMLLTPSLYSQGILPDIIVTKTGDTACLVSLSTIKIYNHVYADLEACNELADSLFSEIQTHDRIEIQNQKIIDDSEIQIANLEGQVKEKVIQSDLSAKQLKRANRKLKVAKFIGSGAGVVALAEAAYIGIQSIKKAP